jgi:hypothetical protein
MIANKEDILAIRKHNEDIIMLWVLIIGVFIYMIYCGIYIYLSYARINRYSQSDYQEMLTI